MKPEISTFALMMVTGTSTLWDRLPNIYKVLTILGLTFMAGGVVNEWRNEQLEIPSRVSALELEVGQLQMQNETAADERREINERIDTAIRLQLRTLCRLDGNTANSCDLAYGGGQRIERDE